MHALLHITGAPHSLPRLPSVAGGFWAVILSQAAWKRIWMECNPTQSEMAVDRSIANIGDMVQPQLLTA